MGCGSANSSQSSAENTSGVTTVPGASPGETQLLAQFSSLNDQQLMSIQREMERWSNPGAVPLGLSSADTATYNQAFDPAIALQQTQNKEGIDAMAGQRGLRMSDTPISETGLRTANANMGSLFAQKAQGQLGLGLQGAQQRINATLGLGSTIPGGGAFNLSQYLQERAAQPTTRTTGTSSMASSQTPSGLQQGAQIAGGVGSLAAAAAAAFAI